MKPWPKVATETDFPPLDDRASKSEQEEDYASQPMAWLPVAAAAWMVIAAALVGVWWFTQ